MRRVYVADYVPARRVSEDRAVVLSGPSLVRGVGADFAQVTQRVQPVVIGGKVVQAGPQKPKVTSTASKTPNVTNGPLSQRAEKTKTALRAGGGVRGLNVMGWGYGVAGSRSMGIYIAQWNQAKQGVIDGVKATQTALDKIDSQLIGVDSQLMSLRDGAGPSAPADVLQAVDTAASARRELGDAVDTLRATIDSMNAAAEQARAAESTGQIMSGSTAQIALDKAYQTSKTLAAQVTAVQRTASGVVAKVEAATAVVNRYIDQVNAQAQVLMQQQAQQAQATDIAYQLTDQQKLLAAQQAAQQAAIQQQQAQQAQAAAQQQAQAQAAYQAQQQQLAQQQAAQQAAYQQQQAQQQAAIAQAQADAQARYQAELARQQQEWQRYLQQQQAAQQAYVPPSYPSVQYPPAQPQYQGGATYAQPYNYAPAYQAPQPQPASYPVQTGYDPVEYYQTPSYGYGDQGFSQAGDEWRGGYVDGYGVGAASPSAVATATARNVLAQANVKIAEARKQIEAARIADEQAAARAKAEADAAAAEAERARGGSSSGGFWTTGRKVAAAVLVAVVGGAAAYAKSKEA